MKTYSTVMIDEKMNCYTELNGASEGKFVELRAVSDVIDIANKIRMNRPISEADNQRLTELKQMVKHETN